jgi:DNA-binding SARP family transcriptional activator
MDELNDGVGAVLRRHRIAAELTQEELAGRAGLSIRALRNIEQNRVRRPHPRSVQRLTATLGLTGASAGWPDAGSSVDSGLRVDVLGPLSVGRGNTVLDLGPYKHRCLLGLLAVRYGHAVGLDEIVDILWADRPPRTCASLVHTYAARVRKVVERPGAGAPRVVVRDRGGYRLDLPANQVDLARFGELEARAWRARRAGDTELTSTLFADALRCWRGPMAGDLSPQLRQHPTTVDASRRRLAVALEWADIAVERGRYDDTLAHLHALAAEEPLHEGVHARLMLALAGTGQQAKALRLFSDLRARLADELGVEPGAEVRDAQLLVLRQQVREPAGLRRSTATGGAGGATPRPPAVPRQLPADVAAFTGRTAHLRRLDAILAANRIQSAVVISAVAGTAGVGKTALAVHWAHLVAEQFPDGQLYINLRGFDPSRPPVTAAEAVRGFLDALEVPTDAIPVGLDARAALYRSLLVGKRVLVVLDNARDAEQVRPLLPGAPTCLVVVTSRNQLPSLVASEGARPLMLDLLTAAEARQLLAQRLRPRRIAAEPRAVDDIIISCAGLPLALAIVAARAATYPRFPLTALADELRRATGSLDAFAGGDPASDVRTVFSWSYRTLSPPAARLFCLLGSHPGPDIAAPATASLAGLAPGQAPLLLAELARAHLITEHVPGRYTSHDLLRAYAAELPVTGGVDDRRDAIGRTIDHYLHTARTAARLVDACREPVTLGSPQTWVTPEELADHEHAQAWLTAERPVLLAVIDAAATIGMDAQTWQLAGTISTFLDRHGHWQDWAATQRTALTAARRNADHCVTANIHRQLARAYLQLARYDDAHTHLRHALDLHRDTGDTVGQAHTHVHFARLYERRGDHAQALDHNRHALRLFHAAGHPIGQARALTVIGRYHAQHGDHERALASCQRALALLDELGDHPGAAAAWDGLGYSHHKRGSHQQAITCFQRAVDLYRDLGHRYHEANVLTHLGDTHRAADHTDEARHCWRQALTILDELRHEDAARVRAKLTG